MTASRPRSSRSARRRHITILFSDLSSFTTLVGSVEPEHCLEVLDAFKTSAYEAVDRHNGIVIDFHGDGVMAMFGFPETSEHDGRRAIEAALELHEATGRLRVGGSRTPIPSLALHSGVHSGLVLLIENDPSPARYALVGEAPSVASRLSDIAVRGEILVSATTLGADSHLFETRDRGRLTLQGITKPLAVLQVLGRSPASTRYQARARGAMTPFIGRTRELVVLHDALRQAMAGGRSEIAVVASAGVGKTRLVEQFLLDAAQPELQVCRGYCENYLDAEPLQPFLQMVRQLARASTGRADGEPTLPELQRALSTELLAGGPAPDAPDPTSAFCDLFGALSRRKPLVVVIDDWQWADDATRHALAALRDTGLAGVFILIASREPMSGATVGLPAITLSPWDEVETNEAIRRLRPEADPFALAQISRLSGGNPLFIEELCHWRARAPFSDAAAESGPLPAWLSTLIESRVARLPAAQAELVHTAAVVGSVIPTWLFSQLTGHDEADALVRDLADKDLIFPGEIVGTLRFKHGVTRDVVYASLGLHEREALHLRVAELLERSIPEQGQDGLLEALAYHYRAAVRPDEAGRYAELAGDKALAAAAPDRARNQYAAALEAIDRLQDFDHQYPRWQRVVHRLGLASVFDPTRDQLTIFQRAAELAAERRDAAGVARAEYWRGFIHYVLGEPREAIAHYERALQHSLEALDAARAAADARQTIELEALGVQLLATIGQARASAGEPHAALELLDMALAVKRRHRRSSRPAIGSAYTLACKGAVLGDIGRFAEAHGCFDEALDAIRAGESPVEASIRGWLSAVLLWQGRWEEARDQAVRAESLARRVTGLYILAMGQAVAAIATWHLDRAEAAIDAIVRATSWLEAGDRRMSISSNYGWLSEILASERRDAQARRYAALALRRARQGDVYGEAAACRAMAAISRKEATAEKYLQRAMRAALGRQSRREEALTWLDQALHAARVGRRLEAEDLARRTHASFAAMDMPWHRARADACLAGLRMAIPPPPAPPAAEPSP